MNFLYESICAVTLVDGLPRTTSMLIYDAWIIVAVFDMVLCLYFCVLMLLMCVVHTVVAIVVVCYICCDCVGFII